MSNVCFAQEAAEVSGGDCYLHEELKMLKDKLASCTVFFFSHYAGSDEPSRHLLHCFVIFDGC